MSLNLTCGRCILFAISGTERNINSPVNLMNMAAEFPRREHCSLCGIQSRVYAMSYPLPVMMARLQQIRSSRPRSPPYPPPQARTQAPAGEDRRTTYVLEEDCPTCFEQDEAGHRMCLRCNASCCNTCWTRITLCPICRFSKN